MNEQNTLPCGHLVDELFADTVLTLDRTVMLRWLSDYVDYCHDHNDISYCIDIDNFGDLNLSRNLTRKIPHPTHKTIRDALEDCTCTYWIHSDDITQGISTVLTDMASLVNPKGKLVNLASDDLIVFIPQTKSINLSNVTVRVLPEGFEEIYIVFNGEHRKWAVLSKDGVSILDDLKIAKIYVTQ